MRAKRATQASPAHERAPHDSRRSKRFYLGTLFLLVSFGVQAGPQVEKVASTSKTTYLAKSLLEDEATWDIRWSQDYAIAGSKVIYSEQAWDRTESSFTGRVLSIVGAYISYKAVSAGYSEGAAHPWHHESFETRSMVNGETVDLTDIFPESAVFDALAADGVVRKALTGEPPANLDELFQRVDGGCEFSLTRRTLTSFVFHHVDGERVAVRLGLSHGCEVMRGNFTQLGFYLPIPESLNDAFEKAQERQLLMRFMDALPY